MNAWWGAATAVGVMVVGGWLLRRVEAGNRALDASSDAWLAAAREVEAAVPSRFANVLGLTDVELGDFQAVYEAERAVYRAWEWDPAVGEAAAVVSASRRRLGHLYVEVER